MTNMRKGAAVLVFIIILLFAIRYNYLAQNPSAGHPVSEQQIDRFPTHKPTEEIFPTLEEISVTNPTDSQNNSKLSDDPIVYLEYSKKLNASLDKTSEAFEKMTAGTQKWPDLTWDETVSLAGATVVLENAYDEIAAMTPPTELKSTHEKYVAAYQLLKDAMPLLRDGMDSKNADLIGQATRKIKLSTILSSEANQELLDFTESLKK